MWDGTDWVPMAVPGRFARQTRPVKVAVISGAAVLAIVLGWCGLGTLGPDDSDNPSGRAAADTKVVTSSAGVAPVVAATPSTAPSPTIAQPTPGPAKKTATKKPTKTPSKTPTKTRTTKPPASNCNPNYTPCVPNDPVDVDCKPGSGNGPSYVYGPVKVIGVDVYDLDRDGDGIGCD